MYDLEALNDRSFSDSEDALDCTLSVSAMEFW